MLSNNPTAIKLLNLGQQVSSCLPKMIDVAFSKIQQHKVAKAYSLISISNVHFGPKKLAFFNVQTW